MSVDRTRGPSAGMPRAGAGGASEASRKPWRHKIGSHGQKPTGDVDHDRSKPELPSQGRPRVGHFMHLAPSSTGALFLSHKVPTS
jgi:hypothetical protein